MRKSKLERISERAVKRAQEAPVSERWAVATREQDLLNARYGFLTAPGAIKAAMRKLAAIIEPLSYQR